MSRNRRTTHCTTVSNRPAAVRSCVRSDRSIVLQADGGEPVVLTGEQVGQLRRQLQDCVAEALTGKQWDELSS